MSGIGHPGGRPPQGDQRLAKALPAPPIRRVIARTRSSTAPRRVVRSGVAAVLFACCVASCGVAPRVSEPPPPADGPRVLCVVAHPDDETGFAGTLYKTATHLGGRCDILVITNGEAGYKYSTLAEVVYGRRLTDPTTGRSELPAIRQAEMREAARVLRVREVFFLSELDHRYTQDPNEVLGEGATVWDLPRVRGEIARVLDAGRYDFVFVHLPVPTTHGHHKAATILALEAVAAMPRERRPIALGAFGMTKDGDPPTHPYVLDGFPITRSRDDIRAWTFDRTQKFGFENKLDYRIVTSWAVAAHKSQGTYQSLLGRGELEAFRMFAIDAVDAVARTDALFTRLAEPQFEALRYDESGRIVR